MNAQILYDTTWGDLPHNKPVKKLDKMRQVIENASNANSTTTIIGVELVNLRYLYVSHEEVV